MGWASTTECGKILNVEVKVKTYPSPAAANRDARQMTVAGWVPQSMSGGGTRYSLSKSINTKAWASAVLGPLGLFATSRAKEPVTITWTRTPKPTELADGQQPGRTAAPGSSALDELAKASTLHEQGVLPHEQFEAMKERLIGQIKADENLIAKEAAAQREWQEQQAAKKQASATIAIYRRPDIWVDRGRRYRTLIDGNEEGRIGPNQRLPFNVSAEEHRVVVKIDILRSNERVVLPKSRETVELICRRSGGHPFLKALFRWKAYLNLDVGT